MSETIIEETGASRMLEAFQSEDVPALRPSGPQAVTIDDSPKGAMVVAVNRNVPRILQNLAALAAAAGDDWFYRWPVKSRDRDTGKEVTEWIEGPSVKCTNAVARQYGNARVDVRALDHGDHWMLYARFYDVETGFELVRPFQQRKAQNIGGKMDKARAMDIVFQIGVSKATRNVVANALPEFVQFAFDKAKEQLVNTVGKRLDHYREQVKLRLEQLGISLDRVEPLVGKKIGSWLAPDVSQIIAQLQAIKDGMADPDEMWPADQAAISEKRPDRADYGKAAGATETAAAKARTPAPSRKKETAAAGAGTFDIKNYVENSIAQTKDAKDLAALDHLDDQVCSTIEREKGGDELRRLWNEAYKVRADELKAGTTGSQQVPAEATLPEWYEGMKKALAECSTQQAVDELEEHVVNELAGEEKMQSEFKDLCLERSRSIRRGGR